MLEAFLMKVLVVGIFFARVFLEIFAPLLAFGFGAVDFAAVTFLGALGFVAFLGTLALGFETLAGAGADVLSTAFLVLAAREGCLRRGGKMCEVIASRKSLLGV